MDLLKKDTRKKRLQYLEELRGVNNITLFCDKNVLSKTTYYRIRNGKGENIKRSTLEPFAKAFDVDVDFLADGGKDTGHYSDEGIKKKGDFGEIQFLYSILQGENSLMRLKCEVETAVYDCKPSDRRLLSYFLLVFLIITRKK